MVAKYLLLSDAFFQPKLLAKGSIIGWPGSPGPHMEPLNEEAKLRMEEWYTEEVEYHTYDDQNRPVTRSWHPHERFRKAQIKEVIQHEVELLRPPARDVSGDIGLGQALLSRASDDQRPGPAVTADLEADKAVYGDDFTIEKAVQPTAKNREVA